eukprot:TRINITY_DN13334_c0_g1_i1.p1 TRINITY_DN13334_c0_g1~~TRINITY_DN13334_c0_g1_i1.p1  ORF type:complete len:103 (-),score=4.44 TRINITY_DN13334_c0_g1_i1:39-347(-)
MVEEVNGFKEYDLFKRRDQSYLVCFHKVGTGQCINPDNILSLVQKICKGSNIGEHGKVLSPSPVAVRIFVFMDAAFNIKEGKSSFSFFMMRYNKPLVAGAQF